MCYTVIYSVCNSVFPINIYLLWLSSLLRMRLRLWKTELHIFVFLVNNESHVLMFHEFKYLVYMYIWATINGWWDQWMSNALFMLKKIGVSNTFID